jgi:hypothetical protein
MSLSRLRNCARLPQQVLPTVLYAATITASSCSLVSPPACRPSQTRTSRGSKLSTAWGTRGFAADAGASAAPAQQPPEEEPWTKDGAFVVRQRSYSVLWRPRLVKITGETQLTPAVCAPHRNTGLGRLALTRTAHHVWCSVRTRRTGQGRRHQHCREHRSVAALLEAPQCPLFS